MVGSFVDGIGEHGPYRWFNGTVIRPDDDEVTAKGSSLGDDYNSKLNLQ
jgi:hypothetical protein